MNQTLKPHHISSHSHPQQAMIGMTTIAAILGHIRVQKYLETLYLCNFAR